MYDATATADTTWSCSQLCVDGTMLFSCIRKHLFALQICVCRLRLATVSLAVFYWLPNCFRFTVIIL